MTRYNQFLQLGGTGASPNERQPGSSSPPAGAPAGFPFGEAAACRNEQNNQEDHLEDTQPI